jgi:hypothetical protein
MSLEQAIQENTAALKELAAIMSKGAPAAAAAPADKPAKPAKGKAEEAPAEKPAKKGYEPRHTKTEMQAAVNEVKELKGVPAAKALIKEVGYDKMADVEKAEDIDKLYDLAKAALGEDEGGGEGDI